MGEDDADAGLTLGCLASMHNEGKHEGDPLWMDEKKIDAKRF